MSLMSSLISSCHVTRVQSIHLSITQCSEVWGSAMYSTALHCIVLNCTSLHYTSLHFTSLHCTALHYPVLKCTSVYVTVVQYRTALQYCTALQYRTALYALFCCALYNYIALHQLTIILCVRYYFVNLAKRERYKYNL